MRKRALVLGGIGVAALVSQRVKPLPCPYSQRWMLELPRPGLGHGELLQALSPRPGQDVLEVGAGNGHDSIVVARALDPGGTLHAFDLQQKMLDALMGRAAGQGVANIEPRQGDARELPYDAESLDAAFLVTVLGEIPDRDAALREIHRVVRPGGRLVVGEIALDPHFVTFGTLRREAAAAGFRWVRRLGNPLSYFAVFDRP